MLQQYCISLYPVTEWKDCLVGQMGRPGCSRIHKPIYSPPPCFEHLLLLYFLSLKKDTRWTKVKFVCQYAMRKTEIKATNGHCVLHFSTPDYPSSQIE